MKKYLIMILALISINAVIAANLTIEADNQQFVDAQNEAKFTGNVKVKLDDITVESPVADAQLDPKSKKLTTANFKNKAHAYQVKNNKKNEVKAEIIKLSLLNKLVQAEGNSETIVTDTITSKPVLTISADKQEYNTETKIMKANGNVVVNYKDATSYSNSGLAKLDKKGEIQELQLIGNAKIKQKNDNFQADKYIYKAGSEDAIAMGNAYSEMHNSDGSVITVRSNFQQYNKAKNTLVASNNVHVTYKDYVADGPKASVFPGADGKLNKVVFSGRSKITQEGRTIEADRITMTIKPKDFHAEGHVKTFIPNVKTISD